MAKTYLSGSNSRGSEVTGAGSRDCHLRGWNTGVQLYANADGSEFTVYMTSGSNGRLRPLSKLLGSVRETPGGPVWEPATSQ